MQTTAFFLWLVLPRDLKLDGGRQSAGAVSLKEVIGLEGVELGADGKVGLPGFQSTSACRYRKGQDTKQRDRPQTLLVGEDGVGHVPGHRTSASPLPQCADEVHRGSEPIAAHKFLCRRCKQWNARY